MNAKRLDLFHALGRYLGDGRQGEESTYCVRLLAAGYVVRVATYGHIDHYPVLVERDRDEVVERSTQNGLNFIWKFTPFPAVLYRWPLSFALRCWQGLCARELSPTMRGGLTALAAIVTGRETRTPVSYAVYRLMRQLVRSGWLPISTVDPLLPDRLAVEELPSNERRVPARMCSS